MFEKELRKERKLKEEHVPRRYELFQRALKDFSKSPKNKCNLDLIVKYTILQGFRSNVLRKIKSS